MVPRFRSRALLFFIAVPHLPHLASATCECGYSVNKTTDPEYAVWTDLLETDFLHIDELKDVGWLPQVYNSTSSNEQSAYGKMAARSNVLPNPLKNSRDWAGESENGGDAGLQLIVRSELVDNMVPFGEVAARTREDMLYGSFRVAMKVGSVPGTCAAFFWVSFSPWAHGWRLTMQDSSGTIRWRSTWSSSQGSSTQHPTQSISSSTRQSQPPMALTPRRLPASICTSSPSNRTKDSTSTASTGRPDASPSTPTVRGCAT